MTLAELDPLAVAREVCELVLAHRARLAMRLAAVPPDPERVADQLRAEGLDAAVLLDAEGSAATARRLVARAAAIGWRAGEPDAEACATGSDLGLTVADLVRYAQTGQGDPDEAEGAVQSVCEALYSPAGLSAGWRVPVLDDEAEPSAVGTVILAALARVRIARGQPVPQRWLRAVAGVSRQRLQQLLARGVLVRAGRAARHSREGGEVTAESARAWLEGRGTTGAST